MSYIKIQTVKLFNYNQEEKNNDNLEANMEIEENQETKEVIKLEENNKEEETKKESKEKRRVRGPNKCYRIIDQFFSDQKRTKASNIKDGIDQKNNNTNEEEEEKKIKKRVKVTNMSSIFDDFLNFVETKTNNEYYNKFIKPIINNYKEFYIEKEKDYKENKTIYNNNEDDI